MTGLPGTGLDPGTRSLIRDYGISNFIIFARNCENGPEALAGLCGEICKLCREEDLEALIAVDQEGGPVRRLKPPLFPGMPSPLEVLSSPDPGAKMAGLAKDAAALLNNADINMNLAPVLDLCLEAEKNVLEGRCFGTEPQQVARLGKIYIRTLQEQGILATAKHFPGIGRVKLDPHFERPVVDASLKELASDMLPFREAIRAGTAAIMTSHVVYSSIDPWRPATFSQEVATRLLRRQLGFKGILLSDDLEMKGITKHGQIGQAAVEAFAAGHDLLLVCNSQENVLTCMESLARAVSEGIIHEERLRASVSRLRQATETAKRAGQHPD